MDSLRTLRCATAGSVDYGKSTLIGRLLLDAKALMTDQIAPSGKSADTHPGQAGELIRKHREARQLSPEQVAEKTGLTAEEYTGIESGSSEIEELGPFFLRFAEVIEQPVFNLFHPFGLPFEKLTLDDYK